MDLPTECDDEYWETDPPFQQPPDKPALAAFGNSFIKLMEIFNQTQRTIVIFLSYSFPGGC